MPEILSKKNSERLVFLLILAVALFFRLFKIDYSFLLNSWPLNLVAIGGGLLGIAFVYLLARELFNWQIGALAAFFASVSAWQVAVSRETLWTGWILNFFILALYFLWKGTRGNHTCNFVFSGLLLGLSLYLNYPFYAPLAVILLSVLAYLHLLEKDFSRDQYIHSRNFLIKGFSWLLVLSLIIFIILRWFNIYGYFFGQGQENLPLYSLSLVMIVLLATGVFRSFMKLVRIFKRHGHFSAAQVIVLSWFFAGLLSEKVIFTLPAILILSAEGCWWFFGWLRNWSSRCRSYTGLWQAGTNPKRDSAQHVAVQLRHWDAEADFVTTLVLVIFLFALSAVEYQNYFSLIK